MTLVWHVLQFCGASNPQSKACREERAQCDQGGVVSLGHVQCTACIHGNQLGANIQFLCWQVRQLMSCSLNSPA